MPLLLFVALFDGFGPSALLWLVENNTAHPSTAQHITLVIASILFLVFCGEFDHAKLLSLQCRSVNPISERVVAIKFTKEQGIGSVCSPLS